MVLHHAGKITVFFPVRPVVAGLVIRVYYSPQPTATPLWLLDSANLAQVSGALIPLLNTHGGGGGGGGVDCLSAAVSAERHRRASSSSQRGLFTCSFWSHVAIPPPPLFLPPASSGFLFSSSGAYHSFLHRCTPTPSCQAMKGYLRDDFFPVQQRTPPPNPGL